MLVDSKSANDTALVPHATELTSQGIQQQCIQFDLIEVDKIW